MIRMIYPARRIFYFLFFLITLFNGKQSIAQIKLTDIIAVEKVNHVLVQWITNTEVNSKHFIVERSTEGTNFDPIGTVVASGNSTTDRSYEFSDVSAGLGINYYRLKMVDLADSVSDSKIVSVDIKSTKSSPLSVASIFYIKSNLQVTLLSKAERPIRIILSDPLGRVLHTSDMILQTGSNVIRRTIPSARGIYHISILDEEGVMTKTIFNQQ